MSASGWIESFPQTSCPGIDNIFLLYATTVPPTRGTKRKGRVRRHAFTVSPFGLLAQSLSDDFAPVTRTRDASVRR